MWNQCIGSLKPDLDIVVRTAEHVCGQGDFKAFNTLIASIFSERSIDNYAKDGGPGEL